jgi:hypothetical protein
MTKSTNPKQWERRPPGKVRREPVLQAADLARELNVPASSLQELAMTARLPFSISTMVGLWIRRADLPQWRNAAQRWRSQ